MIYFLTTASHMYTHRAVAEALRAFKPWSYAAVLSRKTLPIATYVFSDLDRLSPWQLELAARLYRQLKEGGAIVVNDPARVLHRLPLLKRLERAGINSFRAWDAAELDMVDRYPVFVRTRSAHRGVLSDLLHTSAELSVELGRAIAAGYTISDLIIVEFRAEPIRPGLYRKHSVYRIGEHYVGSTSVHEATWMAKIGQKSIGDRTLYDEEYRDVVDNPFAPAMAMAFELAGIEYGRVDFGVVAGRPEVYEINTNPKISRLSDHPFALRAEAGRRVFDDLISSLSAMDTAEDTGSIAIAAPMELRNVKRRLRLFPGYQWQP